MKTIQVLRHSIRGWTIPGHGAPPIRTWCLAVGLFSLSLVGAAQASDTPSVDAVKAPIVTLLKSITMKLNYFVDEKFCRQFFKDFQTQKDLVHIQPIIQADRYDDPALAAFVGKCPRVKWIGAQADDPAYRLNTQVRSGLLAPTLVGTAHFRLYQVDIDNDKRNGREHVFYSDGFVPDPLPGEELMRVEELDKTTGLYEAVDFENCATLGAVEVGRGGTSVFPVYNGVLRYHGRSYIYNLYGYDKYMLNIERFWAPRKNFKIVCRYWQ